ncbi:MAG: STAS/SEC14 domain-containing protein [Bacteroidetes bacterium]|nr:STAS/SEC14 domain-containing protein [Bacteroidota bacterium]MCL2301866.1 STAS/SEC14 domain-containing protein [Lentimicrobiaceae bacterium]
MLTQIKTFKGNALAVELTDTFTKADAQLMMQLFEEKLNEGNEHVNLLLKVKDLSILKHTEFKALMEGEVWGFKHFSKIGRCAVVAQSDIIKDAVKLENKALHLANAAFEEKYFETAQLDEALRFISPEK